MPRGTTLRNVRVDDELWTAALDTASSRSENLSEVIRRALREYVDAEESPGHPTVEQ